MQRTFRVNGEKFQIKVRAKTYCKQFLGWNVDVNGVRFWVNKLCNSEDAGGWGLKKYLEKRDAE